MNINLREGYLFRALNDANAVSDSPFVGAAVANRLKTHLQMANIHGGETMHSFGSSCAITLSLLGVRPHDIARRVGWKSLSTMEHYSQTGKVMRSLKVATTLAISTTKHKLSKQLQPLTLTMNLRVSSLLSDGFHLLCFEFWDT